MICVKREKKFICFMEFFKCIIFDFFLKNVIEYYCVFKILFRNYVECICYLLN